MLLSDIEKVLVTTDDPPLEERKDDVGTRMTLAMPVKARVDIEEGSHVRQVVE